MRRWGIGSIAALGTALLVLVVGGCGGSGSSASTGTSNGQSTTAATTATKGSESGAGKGSAKGRRGQGSGDSAASRHEVQTAPLKVSGGGSVQYRVKGGDNSIQEFGAESDEAELEEAASTLHDYLVARAKEDWLAACANLAKSVEEQLQTLASRSEQLKDKGCAAILEALTPSLPPSARRESTIVDAGSLRVEGEQSFLIYRGARGTPYAVVMVPEGGGWKVGSLGATPLS